jgi:Tfp pilus assembly protein PilO
MAKAKHQPRYGSWLVTISLAAAGILYLMFSFLPTARIVRELRDEIRLRQDFITQSDYLTASLAQAQRNLEAAKRYSTDWQQQLPSPATFPALLGRLTKQADLAGASTTHFEPQAPVEFDLLRQVPVVFEASGSYAEISRLLNGLEQMPERIWIDDMRLEAPRETGQKMQCNLKLTVFAVNSEKSD